MEELPQEHLGEWASLVPSLKLLTIAVRMRKARDERSEEEQCILKVQAKLDMFWRLMLSHSPDPSGVVYSAYEGLHLRISKTLSGQFDQDQAVSLSRNDWKADSVNTVSGKLAEGRSPIDDVKFRFRAASYKLGSSDWVSLFNQVRTSQKLSAARIVS